MKLPAVQRPVQGELSFGPSPMAINYPGMMRASLKTADALVLPEMDRAVITRITSTGIVIHGVEIIARRPSRKSAVDQYRQTWWCQVLTAEVRCDLEDNIDLIWPMSMDGP
jgi:hypothetical protein